MNMTNNTSRTQQLGKRIVCVALASTALAVRVAHAHPAPAALPVFDPVDCVTVVDKSNSPALDIMYTVEMDDTEIAPGDIPLPDAKTHQFFALAGSIFPNGQIYQSYLFDEPEAYRPIDLPIWISEHDVARAAKATPEAQGVTFAHTDVPQEAVLESNLSLMHHWLRITADDARRPIRVTQSLRPVRWDLTDVEPGSYTIAGYVFSPPYNDWTIRPGVVKVKDAEQDPPAGALSPIAQGVFSYEGRRIHGCADVPVGTRLQAYYRIEEQPQLGWRTWLPERDVETGALALCFHIDDRDVSGSLRLRVDLTAQDGRVTTLHSRDTITWLQGTGSCLETDTKCCDFVGAHAHGANPLAAGSGAELRADARITAQPASGCQLVGPHATARSWLFGLALVGCWMARSLTSVYRARKVATCRRNDRSRSSPARRPRVFTTRGARVP